MQFLIIFALISISISNYTQCQLDDGNGTDCSNQYIPVCGFNSDKKQIETYTNDCLACNKNASYFNSEPCIVSTTNDSLNITKYECSIERPLISYQCQNIYCKVCAQLICDNITCNQEFQNECYACSNTTVQSYYFGNCQTASGIFLSFVLLMIL